MKRKLLSVVLGLSLVASLAVGCSSKEQENVVESSSEKTVIKLGVRAASLDQAELARNPLEEKGYELEIITFDDNIAPNVALVEGSIDANMYQHEPYLLNYNSNEGTDLQMVKPKISTPLFGLFSEKHDSVDSIPQGATIGLCNDASNQLRGLRLLEEVGLIKLDETVENPTIYDIVENPKELKFIEAEMVSLPQSIADVDAIALAALHMFRAGKDATSYIASPEDNAEFGVGVVVNSKDINAQWVKDLNDAFRTDEMREYILNEHGGASEPLF